MRNLELNEQDCLRLSEWVSQWLSVCEQSSSMLSRIEDTSEYTEFVILLFILYLPLDITQQSYTYNCLESTMHIQKLAIV